MRTMSIIRRSLILSTFAGLTLAGCAGDSEPPSDEVAEATSAMCPVGECCDPDCDPSCTPTRCYPDGDGDGWGYGSGSWTGCNGACPHGTVDNNLDCDANTTPSSTHKIKCYDDDDGDGYGDASALTVRCGASASVCASNGEVTNALDCNDADSAVVAKITCYRDADGDSKKGEAFAFCGRSCSAGGHASVKQDCDESDASVSGISCTLDEDGDGYSVNGAAYCGTSCPTLPTTTHGGDCNDASAAIHPFQVDKAQNGVDDDCAGTIDQADFDYGSAGVAVGTTSFGMKVRLRHAQVLDYALLNGNAVYAKATYNRLSQHSAGGATSPLLTGTLSSDSAGYYTYLTLSGLPSQASNVVYEVALRFFESNGTTEIGRPSDTYYSLTRSTATDSLTTTRAGMVLDALYEVDQSEDGKVKDGTRYGCSGCDGSSDGEKWCSEFYASMAEPYLIDMSPSDENVTGDLVDYFDGGWDGVSYHGWSQWYSGPSGVSSHPYLGNYINVDTDGNGTFNHSVMLIAYESSTSTLWTVSGNSGNRVKVSSYANDSKINGVGHLATSMLSSP